MVKVLAICGLLGYSMRTKTIKACLFCLYALINIYFPAIYYGLLEDIFYDCYA